MFGPKAFIVVSDPVVVRHLLRENAMNYDKGVLAEILEPIMGKVGIAGVGSLLDMDVLGEGEGGGCFSGVGALRGW